MRAVELQAKSRFVRTAMVCIGELSGFESMVQGYMQALREVAIADNYKEESCELVG